MVNEGNRSFRRVGLVRCKLYFLGYIYTHIYTKKLKCITFINFCYSNFGQLRRFVKSQTNEIKFRKSRYSHSNWNANADGLCLNDLFT